MKFVIIVLTLHQCNKYQTKIMRMRQVFILILILTSSQVSGQTSLVGIKIGAIKANVRSKELSKMNYLIAVSGGSTFDYFLNKHFSLGADFIYEQRGFSNDIIFTDDQGNPIDQKATIKFWYEYYSIPIKVGFKFGNKLYGYSNIGIIPSFLINAETKVPVIKSQNEVSTSEWVVSNVTKSVTRFDMSTFFEIGLGYKLKNNLWPYTSCSFQNSFTQFSNAKYFSSSELKHYGMIWSVGLKCKLSKEKKQ